jgi:hypothetical protein
MKDRKPKTVLGPDERPKLEQVRNLVPYELLRRSLALFL